MITLSVISIQLAVESNFYFQISGQFSCLSRMSGLALSHGSLLSAFQGKKVYQPVWQVGKEDDVEDENENDYD